MNEFLPRTGPVASVVSATERGPTVVRPPSSGKGARSSTEAETPSEPIATARSTAAADYARIQADIADVLARIQPPHASAANAVASANDSLVAMMPSPVVLLPLPPTDPHIVAFVAQVAQSLAEKVAQARAAQANTSPMLAQAAAS